MSSRIVLTHALVAGNLADNATWYHCQQYSAYLTDNNDIPSGHRLESALLPVTNGDFYPYMTCPVHGLGPDSTVVGRATGRDSQAGIGVLFAT